MPLGLCFCLATHRRLAARAFPPQHNTFAGEKRKPPPADALKEKSRPGASVLRLLPAEPAGKGPMGPRGRGPATKPEELASFLLLLACLLLLAPFEASSAAGPDSGGQRSRGGGAQSAGTHGTGTLLTLQMLSDFPLFQSRFPDAVCNDGTPGDWPVVAASFPLRLAPWLSPRSPRPAVCCPTVC